MGNAATETPTATLISAAGGDVRHGSQPSPGDGQRGEGTRVHRSSGGRSGALEMERDSQTARCGRILLHRGAWYLFDVS